MCLSSSLSLYQLAFPSTNTSVFTVDLHTYAHASFIPVPLYLSFCCHLCHHRSMSPGHQALLLSILSSKGVNPLLPDFWGSEPAAYLTMAVGLCFSEPGLCAFLCQALLSARVCEGAAARPCRAAGCLLPLAGRRGDLEAGPSRARLCCSGTAVCGLPQNILSVISSCFTGSLLIFHWGTGADCKAHASKEGSFQQLWGWLLVFPVVAITRSVVFKVGKKTPNHPAEEKAQAKPTRHACPCLAEPGCGSTVCSALLFLH